MVDPVNKPDALRTALLAQVAHLREHPETLSLYIDNGRLATRATGNLSFEYRYRLNLVVQDFAGHLDLIMVPLLAWIAVHQPDLIERAPNEPFIFESEFLDAGAQDLSIELDLTELVRVAQVDGGLSVEHLPEPTRTNAFAGVDTSVTLWQAAAEDMVSGDVVTVPASTDG